MRPQNEPDLMRLYLRHCAVGFALSAVFVAMIIWFNIANLSHLIFSTDAGYLAAFLLWFFNGTVFGSVQFAVSLMLNAETDDEDNGTGNGVPVRVAVTSRTDMSEI